MRTLIVIDSWFGNTEAVAKAIAQGLGGEVKIVKVGDWPWTIIDEFADVDLLIIGSPTHGGFATPRINDLLNLIGDEVKGLLFTCFDTRDGYPWIKVLGFAARRMAKQLIDKGARQVAPPEGFYVSGRRGPLHKGEAKRAQIWGAFIRQQLPLGVKL